MLSFLLSFTLLFSSSNEETLGYIDKKNKPPIVETKNKTRRPDIKKSPFLIFFSSSIDFANLPSKTGKISKDPKTIPRLMKKIVMDFHLRLEFFFSILGVSIPLKLMITKTQDNVDATLSFLNNTLLNLR